MKDTKLSVGKKAHLYALLAWNDISKEDALKIIEETPYEKLNEKTWAETSVESAMIGIKKRFNVLENAKPEDDFSKTSIENIAENYDKVIEILEEIHDKWVAENAKKYDRGNEAKSEKNIFQHTPTALIGMDEVAKDLMFLAPFLDEMGLNAGEMEMKGYGAFKPSPEVAKAYQRYVENYMEKHNIYTKEDLEEHLKNCIKGEYKSLEVTDEISKKRVEYMKGKVPKIMDSIGDKNKEQLGAIPEQYQL